MSVVFSLPLPIQSASLRRPAAMQQARLPLRAALAPLGSRAYFGQALRPQLARGLCPARGRRAASRQLQVQAAIFGVGAPEAILVGVVALLVFGPKGLAQAAKSLGETLRAFQPTIRELTQVSAELKSTLETEIGINEIKEELRRPLDAPRPVLAEEQPSSSQSLTQVAEDMAAKVQGAREDMARVVDPDIEQKRAEAAKLAWGGAAAAAPAGTAAAAAPTAGGASAGSSSAGAPAAAAGSVAPTTAAAPAGGAGASSLDGLSIDQLEAELQRRKAAAASMPKELKADE